MKTIILKANGTAPYVKDVEPALEALQEEVGGDIEAVYSVNPELTEKLLGYADGEGRITNRPINRNILALRKLGFPEPTYRGDMIVVGPFDADGNDTDVPTEIIELLGIHEEE